jgi:hypothetical protein
MTGKKFYTVTNGILLTEFYVTECDTFSIKSVIVSWNSLKIH